MSNNKVESYLSKGQENVEESFDMAEGWLGWLLESTKNVTSQLWDIGLIRYYVYIYGILASVPMGIFLAYMTATVTGTSGFTSVVWVLIQGSLTGLGLVVLVPVLIGCFFVAGFFWILYSFAAVGFNIAAYLYRFVFGGDEDIVSKAQQFGVDTARRTKSALAGESGGR